MRTAPTNGELTRLRKEFAERLARQGRQGADAYLTAVEYELIRTRRALNLIERMVQRTMSDGRRNGEVTSPPQ
jgi:hypothetical protein